MCGMKRNQIRRSLTTVACHSESHSVSNGIGSCLAKDYKAGSHPTDFDKEITQSSRLYHKSSFNHAVPPHQYFDAKKIRLSHSLILKMVLLLTRDENGWELKTVLVREGFPENMCWMIWMVWFQITNTNRTRSCPPQPSPLLDPCL